MIRALLDSYQEDHIHNRAFLPLADRLRDFLITQFGLTMNGRRQTRKGITVHLPSVLAYDLHDGENCCKRSLPAPPGFEVVSAPVLALWSKRLLENWNLYKSERQKKAPPGRHQLRRREALPRPNWRPRAAGWLSSMKAPPAGR